MAEVKVIKKEEKANIAYIGGEGAKPLTEVNAQGLSFKLPEDQSKPFYHERAKFVIQHFPHLYKTVKAIGA